MPDYDQLAYNLRKPLSVFLMSYEALLDLGRGTAMPTVGHDGAAVQAGARFWRTDLGLETYYDGTRWLTVNEYPYAVLPFQTFSVTNTFTDVIIRTDYAPYITRVVTGTNPAATNDGSNFWTVTIAGINSARVSSTTIDTFDTHLDTAGAEALRDNAPSSSATPTNRTYLRCIGAKTGAPGNMTISHTIYTRLIIT